MAKPTSLDYSYKVTLVRNQNGCGGCGGMATLHVFDIMMELLAPYTPDGSFAFNAYVFNDSMGFHGPRNSLGNQSGIVRDSRIKKHGLDQCGVIKEYGCSPESKFHSTFDPPRQLFPNEPKPDNEAFQHASKYKIMEYSTKNRPSSIEKLTDMLYENGPLVFAHTPEGSTEGHVVALIGYNDDTKKIKYINSIGGPYGGIQELSYDYFLGRLQNLNSEQGVTYMKVAQYNPDRYVARVNISHFVGRRYLWVKIGVEGQMPMTVWSFNCCVNMVDDTMNLVIDVPLPQYANTYWPPQKGDWWYLEIFDSSPSGSPDITGYLEEVVLVKRTFTSNSTLPNCSETRPSSLHLPIKKGETLKVFIPTRRMGTKLNLSVDRSTFITNGMVTFKCFLYNMLIVSNFSKPVVPQKNKKIEIYSIKSDPIEGTLLKAKIGSSNTDGIGKCNITYNPIIGDKFQAICIDKSGKLIASSSIVTI